MSQYSSTIVYSSLRKESQHNKDAALGPSETITDDKNTVCMLHSKHHLAVVNICCEVTGIELLISRSVVTNLCNGNIAVNTMTMTMCMFQPFILK